MAKIDKNQDRNRDGFVFISPISIDIGTENCNVDDLWHALINYPMVSSLINGQNQ